MEGEGRVDEKGIQIDRERGRERERDKERRNYLGGRKVQRKKGA